MKNVALKLVQRGNTIIILNL